MNACSYFLPMQQRKGFPATMAMLAALMVSGCLVDRGGSGEGGETGSVIDGAYVPVKPVAPAGWPSKMQHVVPPSKPPSWQFHMIHPVELYQWNRSPRECGA